VPITKIIEELKRRVEYDPQMEEVMRGNAIIKYSPFYIRGKGNDRQI